MVCHLHNSVEMWHLFVIRSSFGTESLIVLNVYICEYIVIDIKYGICLGRISAVFGKGAVGAIFDDNGNAEGALGQFEEEVRAAGDKNVTWWMITKTEKVKMSTQEVQANQPSFLGSSFSDHSLFGFGLPGCRSFCFEEKGPVINVCVGFSVRNKGTVIFLGGIFPGEFAMSDAT